MAEIAHGTPGAYNRGCHCDLCRECNRLRHQARRNHIRSIRKLIDGRWTTTISIVQHGTANAYENWQCRCLPCVERHRIDMREYYAKNRRRGRA